MSLEISFKEQVRHFKKLSKKTHRKASAKHVHDLRVATRRLRADLWVIPKESRTKSAKKSLKFLKKLGKILGEQRKYDVALEDAQQFGTKTKKIKEKQKKGQKEVLKFLSQKRQKEIHKLLEETSL